MKKYDISEQISVISCNDCELGLRFMKLHDAVTCATEEIESRIYLQIYHLRSESVGKSSGRTGREGGSNRREDGGESYLNFKCPLRRQHGRI